MSFTEVRAYQESQDNLGAYPAIESALMTLPPVAKLGAAKLLDLAPHIELKGSVQIGNARSNIINPAAIPVVHSQKLAEAIGQGKPLFGDRERHLQAAFAQLELVDSDIGDALHSLSDEKDVPVLEIVRNEIQNFNSLPYRTQVALVNLVLAHRLHLDSGLDSLPITGFEGKSEPSGIVLPSQRFHELIYWEAFEEKGPVKLAVFTQLLEEYFMAMPLKLTSDRHELSFDGVISKMLEKIALAYLDGEDVQIISAAAHSEAQAYLSKHFELNVYHRINFAQIAESQAMPLYLAHAVSNLLTLNYAKAMPEEAHRIAGDFVI